MFTAIKGSTKELLTLALVPSTALKEVSHLLVNCCQKRPEFRPSVLYSDTCPNGLNFWRRLFGMGIVLRLGLFHLLHRIVDTLDPRCAMFWKASVELKSSIYQYEHNQEAALLQKLKDGSFDPQSKRYTDEEIDAIRHSKAWKSRFEAYLPKKILPAPRSA